MDAVATTGITADPRTYPTSLMLDAVATTATAKCTYLISLMPYANGRQVWCWPVECSDLLLWSSMVLVHDWCLC